MRTIAYAVALAAASGSAAALAQGHAGHDGTGHAAPAAEAPAGAWSYAGRGNPDPTVSGRWIMVPGEGNGAFVSARGMSAAARCAALLRSPRVMVDRATQAACGRPQPAAAPSPGGHDGHRH